MPNISPGVYTKIFDMSTYVSQVPGTIGFMTGLSKKGRDNELLFVGSRQELISEWGEPNIIEYGKNYGQGLYNAYNYLGESGSLYWMRPLPDDAAYSNIRIDASYNPLTDSTASILVTYVDSINTKEELKTSLESTGTTYPIGILYPIGRGDYYNGISVRFTEHANPLLSGVYVLDIYERQSDGDEVIVESFEVSFNPNAKDLTGDSIYIGYILETYSGILRWEMTTADESYTSGYDLVVKVYDKDLTSSVEVDKTQVGASIKDIKQDFSEWQSLAAPATYLIVVKDGRGNSLHGWCGASFDSDASIEIYMDNQLTTRGWNGNTSLFDENSTITYQVRKSNTSIATAFASAEPVPMKKGSDGALLNSDGSLNQTVATTLLSQAYSGLLDDKVLDTENVYFTLVFDCGYPDDVKTQISTLCQTRRDCVGIIDNGDNATFQVAIENRETAHTFNTYFVSIFENYNKVYDIFTGQDIWVSPCYHMSYILPRNDRVAELWYAAAGFNRASIDSIKEVRFNPRLGQRDKMYLKQLNPIVHFAPGYVVWGQLTSQSKASALQDLNIVRLVLYIDRAFKEYCRFFIFEQNDQITWNSVSGDLIDFLEQIKRKRGLYNYSVDVGATDYEKKNKTFHVNVTLEPTRVVEKIELNFYIK